MSNAMTQLAQELGLSDEDLCETVLDIMSERASCINNEGLAGQIEFLFADYCDHNPETLRALLHQVVKEKQAD